MSLQMASQALSRKVILPHDSDTPLLSCSIELPQLPNDKRFNRFYDKICNNCVAFCQKELLKKCLRLSTDSTGTYLYRLRYKAAENDGSLTITIYASLSDKQARKLLSSYKEAHLWQMRENSSASFIGIKKLASNSPFATDKTNQG